MKPISRLLFLGSAFAAVMLYGSGLALALPHSHENGKVGKGSWSEGWYGNDDWDDDKQWGDKDKKKANHNNYKKPSWEEYGPKKDWSSWGHGKEEKWYGGKDWGKDPDCDPPMTHTPEPGTLVLLGSSLAAAAVAWRQRRGPSST